MSDRLVPGEEQLESLRRWLIGNELFGRQRGLWGGSFYDLVMEIIKSAGSPTASQKAFQRFVADAEVLAKRLAILHRDGWEAAQTELRRALTNRRYVIKGEEAVALEETSPVTVVMFEPERLLVMIRWILLVANQRDLWAASGPGPRTFRDKYGIGDKPFSLTEELLEAFPRLLDRPAFLVGYKVRMTDLKGGVPKDFDLGRTYNEMVSENFPQLSEKLGPYGHAMPPGTQRMWLASGTYRAGVIDWEGDHFNQSPTFAILCKGDQREVLSSFTREQQKRIATWQIDLPLLVYSKLGSMPFCHILSQFCMGFHPELDQEVYQRRRPSFTSKGVSHGYGVTCLFRDESEDYMSEPPEEKTDEIISECAKNLRFLMDVV